MGLPKEEVSCTINNLEKEKAPGLIGFNIGFFQHCWIIINGDIMDYFVDLHERCAVE